MKKRTNNLRVTLFIMLFSTIAFGEEVNMELAQPDRAGCIARSKNLFEEIFQKMNSRYGKGKIQENQCNDLYLRGLNFLNIHLDEEQCSKVVACEKFKLKDKFVNMSTDYMNKFHTDLDKVVADNMSQYMSEEKFTMLGMFSYMKEMDKGKGGAGPFANVKTCNYNPEIKPESFSCFQNNPEVQNAIVTKLRLATREAISAQKNLSQGVKRSSLLASAQILESLSVSGTDLKGFAQTDNSILNNAVESFEGIDLMIKTRIRSANAFSYEKYFTSLSQTDWNNGGVVPYVFFKEKSLTPNASNEDILKRVMAKVKDVSAAEDLLPEPEIPAGGDEDTRIRLSNEREDRFIAKINRIDAKLAESYLTPENCNSVKMDFSQICQDLQTVVSQKDLIALGAPDDSTRFTQSALMCARNFPGLDERVRKENDRRSSDYRRRGAESDVSARAAVRTMVESDPELKSDGAFSRYSILGGTSSSSRNSKLISNIGPDGKEVKDNSLLEKEQLKFAEAMGMKNVEEKKDAPVNSSVTNFDPNFGKSASEIEEAKKADGKDKKIEDENVANASTNAYFEKRLKDLEEREKSINKSIEQKTQAAQDSETDAQLQELRKQLAALKAEKDNIVKVNKANTVANAASAKAMAAQNAANAVSNSSANNSEARIIRSGEDQDLQKAAQNKIASESAASRNNNSELGSANISSGRTSGSAQAIRDSANNNAGLVLTKVSDANIDYSKIPDNPKEADIFMLIERSGGEPFLIRERGVLMTVVVELDSEGKPLLIKGKKQFKKTRLKAEQEKQILSEVNSQRALKEVQNDPARKYRLDELMKSLKRP